jgi:hypothetical protein
MATTYLDLPPNMGGTQFGPFQGTIQIGSDPQQCQIVLNQQMGIAPVHVTIADQGDGNYMVAPAQRGFGLFLARGGGAGVQPIGGATQATTGDAIILGNPGGPRFTLRYVQGAGAGVPHGAAGARGGGSMGDRVAREIWRQESARLMMRNRWFRDLSQMWYRYRTGAMTNPRILVGLISSIVVMFMAGVASCGGIFAALQHGLLGHH